MTSTVARLARSAWRAVSPTDSSPTRLCAEALAGIADPLLPALRGATVADPGTTARSILSDLLAPLTAAEQRCPVPDWLLDHQADATRRLLGILGRFGGALLADGVGLGKTRVALAVALHERRRGGDAVAVVPAAIRDEWRREMAQTGVALPLHTHTDLARTVPALSGRSTLLVVDEAHAFRNSRTRRYDTLARLAFGRRVLLLTATPFNNHPSDLCALIHLFAANDHFRELGVPDLSRALADEPGQAALVLAALSVCRTRRSVTSLHPHLERAFPRRRLLAPATYDLEAAFGHRLDDLLRLLQRADSGTPAGPLLLLGLLRRAESSRAALERSLRRQRDFLAEVDRAAADGITLTRRLFARLAPRLDDDALQLGFWPILLQPDGAVPPAFREAQACTEAALALLSDLPNADPKLDALEALLDGPLAGAKTIVFTEYRDTARAVFARLRRSRRVLALTGDRAWAGNTTVARRHALDAFAPRARGAYEDPLLAADILVATDVASEGMNLQDADAVVCYDLPWNPVRVMQRVGRVDRLGTTARQVRVAHVVPRRGLGTLALAARTLRTKLEAAARTLSPEPDPLAALWWLDAPRLDAEAIERESWRRVAPFEARERWRALAGARPGHGGPIVAAACVDDGGPSAAGLLFALTWRDGRRIPLAFVAGPGRTISRDPHALGDLAERALRGRTLVADPSAFTDLLVAAMPRVRTAAQACSAARVGGSPVSLGRGAALARLEAAAATSYRERGDLEGVERALALLRHELPVGADRLLARLATEAPDGRQLAARIAELLADLAHPTLPDVAEVPRILLVAGLLIVTPCEGSVAQGA